MIRIPEKIKRHEEKKDDDDDGWMDGACHTFHSRCYKVTNNKQIQYDISDIHTKRYTKIQRYAVLSHSLSFKRDSIRSRHVGLFGLPMWTGIRWSEPNLLTTIKHKGFLL